MDNVSRFSYFVCSVCVMCMHARKHIALNGDRQPTHGSAQKCQLILLCKNKNKARCRIYLQLYFTWELTMSPGNSAKLNTRRQHRKRLKCTRSNKTYIVHTVSNYMWLRFACARRLGCLANRTYEFTSSHRSRIQLARWQTATHRCIWQTNLILTQSKNSRTTNIFFYFF